MGDKTGIEWTDATWNPTLGCSIVSPGCTNCYAMRMAARLESMGNAAYTGLTSPTKAGPVWTGEIRINPGTLDQPLRWRRARRIFANSMSDLFHESLAIHEIATVYAIAVAAVHLHGHTIQILTKRAERMFDVLKSEEFWDQLNAEAGAHVMAGTDPLNRRSGDARATLQEYGPNNPPPGIWLGVSAENQAHYDQRWAHLSEIPARVHFISYEPALGPLDIRGRLLPDWVIAGGESGTGARPAHPEWFRSLRDQCAKAGVPFFFKQWGAHSFHEVGDSGQVVPPIPMSRQLMKLKRWENGEFRLAAKNESARSFLSPGLVAAPANKHDAGDLLDGVQHHNFPEA